MEEPDARPRLPGKINEVPKKVNYAINRRVAEGFLALVSVPNKGRKSWLRKAPWVRRNI